MTQFKILSLLPINFFGYKLDFTNSALSMAIATSLVLVILYLQTKKKAKAYIESYFNFISYMIKDAAGEKAMFALPFVSSLFMFIAFSNLIGLIPNVFTATSHVIVNFTISSIVLLYVLFHGFRINGIRFLKVFYPSGLPIVAAPVVVIVEVFSFLMRAVSLALRLCANMFVGHLLMKVLIYLAIQFGYFGILVCPIYVSVLFFELMIAILHAYIFSLLACTYIKDTIELEH